MKRKSAKSISGALPSPLAAQALERTQIAKYHTKGGHGFSAEDANHLADILRGKCAKLVGKSNELNGPDRIVDGLRVQSKYFRTAAETVAAAFDWSSGTYRYDGQVLEVPNDQYEACLELMRDKIARGQVPEWENPADAEKIVHQGTVTYKQARNIARAGNVDSLIFDAKTQADTSSYVFAVSYAITFAQGRWRGESAADSTKAALCSALAAGGTTLVTGVVSAQILRTKIAASGMVSVRSGMKTLSGTTMGHEVVHRIAAGSLGKAVYGAAAVNHVSKLLRSNAITSAITTLATSTPDFYRAAFERSISWRQFTKNFSVNAAGTAAGTAGWLGGAAAGAAIGSVIPGFGTAAGGMVGGVIGALGGGISGSSLAKTFVDKVAEDDHKPLLAIIEDEMGTLSFEYLLSADEVERIAAQVSRKVTPHWLRGLWKETQFMDNEAIRAFVRAEFEPQIEVMARERTRISLPLPEELAVEMLSLIDALQTEGVKQKGAGNMRQVQL